jgi:hypothetical protein
LGFDLAEVEYYGLYKVVDVDLDFNKDIEHLVPSISNRHKTTMPIVNEQMTVHPMTSKIINTTGPIGNISHNDNLQLNGINLPTKNSQNIRNDTSIQHESFGKL